MSNVLSQEFCVILVFNCLTHPFIRRSTSLPGWLLTRVTGGTLWWDALRP